jgi:hypothetical protein
MKKRMLIAGVLLAAGTVITLNSCKKEIVQPQNLTSNVAATSTFKSVSNGDLKAENVGIAHNQILELYLSQYPKISPVNYETQTVFADNFMCSFLEQSFHKNYYCDDIASVKTEHIAYEKVTAGADFNDYLAQFDAQLQRLTNVNGHDVLSANAKQLMAEYRQVLFGSKTFSDVLHRMDVLESHLNTKTITKVDKELIVGIISITRASTEYWSRPENDQNGGQNRGPIGDGVGFLAGWASSVWSEWWSNGSLCECNSGHRLGQGVIWGAAGSVGSPA